MPKQKPAMSPPNLPGKPLDERKSPTKDELAMLAHHGVGRAWSENWVHCDGRILRETLLRVPEAIQPFLTADTSTS